MKGERRQGLSSEQMPRGEEAIVSAEDEELPQEVDDVGRHEPGGEHDSQHLAEPGEEQRGLYAQILDVKR